jgi:hypothetical protein
MTREHVSVIESTLLVIVMAVAAMVYICKESVKSTCRLMSLST